MSKRVTKKELEERLARAEAINIDLRGEKYELARKLEDKVKYNLYEVETKRQINEAEYRGLYEGFREATKIFLTTDKEKEILALERAKEIELDRIRNRNY